MAKRQQARTDRRGKSRVGANAGWMGVGAGLLLALGLPSPARGASDTKTLTVRAVFDSAAHLTLSPSAISFADADPDLSPSITANTPVAVSARARTGRGLPVVLFVHSESDLTSGTDTIPITNVSWTSTGSGFVSGTLDTADDQPAGVWIGAGVRNGTFTFSLVNRWGYAAGSYTATVTYTLTAL